MINLKIQSLLKIFLIRIVTKIDKCSVRNVNKILMIHFMLLRVTSISKIFSTSKNTNHLKIQIKILIQKNNRPSKYKNEMKNAKSLTKIILIFPSLIRYLTFLFSILCKKKYFQFFLKYEMDCILIAKILIKIQFKILSLIKYKFLMKKDQIFTNNNYYFFIYFE